MQRNHILALISFIFIVGVALIWGVQHSRVSTQSLSGFEGIKARVSNIPTPNGWYVWYGGVQEVKHADNSPQGAEIVFSDHVFDENGYKSTPIILDVYGEGLSGKTPEQWINYNQTYGGYDEDPSLRAATSSGNTSSTQNGRLIIENITTTMGGSHVLSYYLFDNGTVYHFSLSSVSVIPDIINSPDAQLLRDMMKQFAIGLDK
jgi:hypothetical protein